MKKTAIIVLIASITIAVLPILSVLIAGFTAHTLGCTLNEAGPSVCQSVFGDIGGTLSFMGLFGWYVFYTVPLGFAGILVSIVLFIVHFVTKKKKPPQP